MQNTAQHITPQKISPQGMGPARGGEARFDIDVIGAIGSEMISQQSREE